MSEKLIKLLGRDKKWDEIKSIVTAMHAADAAELLIHLEHIDRAVVFRLLPRKFAAKVFSYLKHSEQDSLLKDLTNQETNELLKHLSPDDRTDLFEELPAEVTKKLLKLLSPEDLQQTYQLLGYPEDSVGRQMTPKYIAIQPSWTVKKSLQYIKKHGPEKETIDIVYVIDKKGRLVGDLKLKYLVCADDEVKVEDLESGIDTPPLSVTDDITIAIDLIKKRNIVAIPVVDSKGFLMGIVTIDDLIDLDQEEVTEDFHKIGGISHGDDSSGLSSLGDAAITFLYKKRIYWLLLLVFVNIFSGSAIASFEDLIAESVALVFFLPLLIDSGGNAGAQSATLMVRAIATGDIKVNQWFKMISKELSVSLMLGISMAFAVSFIGLYRGGPDLAVIVSMAMVLIVMVGSLVGMSLPFIFTKLNRDPAAASGPLVTSIADICGVLIYFSIASWYMGI
jgi:magnesium transporter